MRLIRLLGLLLVIALPSATFAPPRRPEISGVALVRLHVTNLDASRKFYADTLGLPQGSQGCFSPTGAATCFFISFFQQIELVSGDAPPPTNAVQALGFQVADAAELRQYL